MDDREPAEACPPPEALDAVAVAGGVARRLWRDGLHVRFDPAAGGGRVGALLRDAGGDVIARLTPSGVLEIAAGEAAALRDAGGARPCDGVLGAARPGLAVPGEDGARAGRGERVE
ncbi:MAG TPA: hypothetical protein VM299_05140 [Solirubrobacteraceae bacterium]|jgi:hypothetical protein|nr:hypothetical protein [Solirubrobacteraceae bacterium]